MFVGSGVDKTGVAHPPTPQPGIDVPVSSKILVEDGPQDRTEDGVYSDIRWVQEGHHSTKGRDIRVLCGYRSHRPLVARSHHFHGRKWRYNHHESHEASFRNGSLRLFRNYSRIVLNAFILLHKFPNASTLGRNPSKKSDQQTSTTIGPKRLQPPSAARNSPVIISIYLNAFFTGSWIVRNVGFTSNIFLKNACDRK